MSWPTPHEVKLIFAGAGGALLIAWLAILCALLVGHVGRRKALKKPRPYADDFDVITNIGSEE